MACRVQANGVDKKLTRRDAELAFWYHIDPRTLTKTERFGYLANLERMKAQHTIHLGNFDAFDYKAVYGLWMAAYGDEDLARKAQAQAAEAYMERACKAARG